jgi:hypothetical protein
VGQLSQYSEQVTSFIIGKQEFDSKNFLVYAASMNAVEQLVEALRYKPESRGFDSRWCH